MKKIFSILFVFTFLLLTTSTINVASASNISPSVQIKSVPAATPFTNSEYSYVNAKVGDTIDFIKSTQGSNITNSSFQWKWDSSKLSCSGYPDFDSDTFRCKVIANGDSTVNISITFYLSDGTKSTQGSNLITVKATTEPTIPPSVQIKSVPATTSYANSEFSYVNSKVGDTIDFIKSTQGSNISNSSFQWKWDKAKLSCAGYPDFDSDTFRCKVIATGSSAVNISVTFYLSDGTKSIQGSNLITVKATTEPVIVQTEDNTEVETFNNIPPAGYEDEVITNFATYSNPFPDTNIASTEGKAAAELHRRAVIGGFPDGEFKGGRNVNRAEAAKFLLLARGTQVQELTNNGKFWDVKDGEWYTKYVMTAAQKGVISGHPDGSFKPADTVNTAEFLKMLTLAFNLQKNMSYSYTDINSSDWFAQYAGVANKYNLFPKRTASQLQPSRHLSRDEVAVAIYQYLLNR